MEERLRQEHELLLKNYPVTRRSGPWFLIADYRIACDKGWNRTTTAIAFQANGSHPAAPPYGFHVFAGILCNGTGPSNYSEPSPAPQPPFEGTWGMFSWTIQDTSLWIPRVDLVSGANLLSFARSFADRFGEGV